MHTKRNTWKNKELEFLKINYSTEPVEILTKNTNKAWSTIQKKAREFNIKRKCKINKSKKGWTEEKLNLLREIYPNKPKKEILKSFNGKNWHAIEEYARRHNIKRNENSLFYKGRKGDLNCLLQETPVSYYWIGFIFADGYIHHKTNQLIIFIDKKDKAHLKKYATYVKGNIKYYTYKKRYDKNSPEYISKMCRVAIAQKNIVPKIISKFNFKETKTYNPPDPIIINNILNTREKFVSFLSGFIDGDGNVREHQIKIETHASWIEIHKLFKDLLYKFYKIETNTKCFINKKGYSILSICNKTLLAEIKKDILKLKIPYLHRKWKKINENEKHFREKYLDKIQDIKNEIKNGLTVSQISSKLNIKENSLRSEIHKHKLNYNRINKK